MKRSLIFIICSFTIFGDSGAPALLKLQTPHRLLGDKVRVRVEAATSAEAIAELPIGTEVIPVSQTDMRLTQNGVEAPWYEVRFTDKGKNQTGYIWGGLIAKGYADSKDGTLFLFGVGRRQKDLSVGTEYTSQVRVVRNGKELQRLEIKEGASYESRHEVHYTGPRGLDKINGILTVHFVQEYCAGKGNTMFFFWTGKKLLHAHSSIDGSDAPYYAIEKQIFPDDKGGRKGVVVIEQEFGDHDNPKSVKKERVVYRWNGTKLEKAS